jgi:hypothetical protein
MYGLQGPYLYFLSLLGNGYVRTLPQQRIQKQKYECF